ncbi:MAG: hypothetical protein FWC70_11750 [Defluviitaleaceae bacterium]|nr:hypothetical protein [Defluviitaleaceae bacterium]
MRKKIQAIATDLFGRNKKRGFRTRFKTGSVSAVIIILAMLAGCACDAGSNGDYVPTCGASFEYESEPQTVRCIAEQYVENMAQGLAVGIFDPGSPDAPVEIRPANIIETRINTLEKEETLTGPSGSTIELWRLDFEVRTDDLESETLRWGTFSPDADGWVGHHTGWNDARVLLLIDSENVALSGIIPWYEEEAYGLFDELLNRPEGEEESLSGATNAGQFFIGIE